MTFMISCPLASPIPVPFGSIFLDTLWPGSATIMELDTCQVAAFSACLIAVFDAYNR